MCDFGAVMVTSLTSFALTRMKAAGPSPHRNEPRSRHDACDGAVRTSARQRAWQYLVPRAYSISTRLGPRRIEQSNSPIGTLHRMRRQGRNPAASGLGWHGSRLGAVSGAIGSRAHLKKSRKTVSFCARRDDQLRLLCCCRAHLQARWMACTLGNSGGGEPCLPHWHHGAPAPAGGPGRDGKRSPRAQPPCLQAHGAHCAQLLGQGEDRTMEGREPVSREAVRKVYAAMKRNGHGGYLI